MRGGGCGTDARENIRNAITNLEIRSDGQWWNDVNSRVEKAQTGLGRCCYKGRSRDQKQMLDQQTDQIFAYLVLGTYFRISPSSINDASNNRFDKIHLLSTVNAKCKYLFVFSWIYKHTVKCVTPFTNTESHVSHSWSVVVDQWLWEFA